MMSGAKVPDLDACGLFRAAHSHNPARYSHKERVDIFPFGHRRNITSGGLPY